MKYLFMGLAVILGCIELNTSASAMNCVEYVKLATGLNLMGNAYQWWSSASNVLDRGYSPAPGAIMVFGRTARMHVGHVAVVRQILSSREILIDQANWHHGRVDHGVSVIDTSSMNDWSSVQVEWQPKVYGGPFPITGFIYAQPHAMDAVERTRVERAGPRLVEASIHRNRVRIYRGMAVSHAEGHLVLADLHHGKRVVFTLARIQAVRKTEAVKKHDEAKPAHVGSHSGHSAASKVARSEPHAAKHRTKSTKHLA